MLGKGVHGQEGVLRGERDLRGVRAGTPEYANQPPTGLLLRIPRYLFNMGPAYMFSRGVETVRIDTWGADYIPSTDEIWEIPVGEEGPPDSRDLFLQVCCWTEDAATGISPDAEQVFDRRRENLKDERRKVGGE